ncbi:MAG: cytochrome C oxidase subunit II [Deltaproteobacteria bacterium]|nr:MAG: cytochrome C oxidase subunit II [Deltaproteobacteria bacterium]
MLNWLPEAASSYAGDFDRLLSTINWITGVWFLLAEAVLIYLVIRYRRRPGRRAAYLPANSLRSMSFVLVPCAVILGFDLLLDGVSAPVWDEIKLQLPPHDEQVRIQGEQWAWRITYPGPDGQFDTADDIETVNDLRVPNDKVILFELTAKDVLHSLWIPELRLKQDAVPGRTIRGWFRPTREGEFEVICAEICGFAHSMMKGSLRIESAREYERWLASKAAEPRRG